MTKSKDESEQKSAPLTSESQTSKEIEEISPEIAGEVLSAIPENKRQAVITVFMNLFSGPIPPPEKLEHYERITSGAADRMITIAEKEQDIRGSDNAGLRKNDLIFLLSSTFISFCLIVGAVICAYLDQVWIAIILVSPSLITTIRLLDRFGKKRKSNK